MLITIEEKPRRNRGLCLQSVLRHLYGALMIIKGVEQRNGASCQGKSG